MDRHNITVRIGVAVFVACAAASAGNTASADTVCPRSYLNGGEEAPASCTHCTCTDEVFFPAQAGVPIPSNLGGILWLPGAIVEDLGYDSPPEGTEPTFCGRVVLRTAEDRTPRLEKQLPGGEWTEIDSTAESTDLLQVIDDPTLLPGGGSPLYNEAILIRPTGGFEENTTYRVSAPSYHELDGNIPDDCLREVTFETGVALEPPTAIAPTEVDECGALSSAGVTPAEWAPFLAYHPDGYEAEVVGLGLGKPAIDAISVACGDSDYTAEAGAALIGWVPGTEFRVEAAPVSFFYECGFYVTEQFPECDGNQEEPEDTNEPSGYPMSDGCSVASGPARNGGGQLAILAALALAGVLRRARRR